MACVMNVVRVCKAGSLTWRVVMRKRGSIYDFRRWTVTENRGCKDMDFDQMADYFGYANSRSDGYDSNRYPTLGYQERPEIGYQPDDGYFEIVVPPGKPRRKPMPVCIVKYRLPWPTGRDLLHMFVGAVALVVVFGLGMNVYYGLTQ